eukprot:TRINITY_DN51360_c0_g1_i1.p1 TRINITY_DN51360_c0_g1~~TRINITY_DN51360_c0_g1_i1.p1  ORF type:complete len:793 (+),score=104.15 TRINITY_DN51360_c0_g1_i1:179-2380(+)
MPPGPGAVNRDGVVRRRSRNATPPPRLDPRSETFVVSSGDERIRQGDAVGSGGGRQDDGNGDRTAFSTSCWVVGLSCRLRFFGETVSGRRVASKVAAAIASAAAFIRVHWLHTACLFCGIVWNIHQELALRAAAATMEGVDAQAVPLISPINAMSLPPPGAVVHALLSGIQATVLPSDRFFGIKDVPALRLWRRSERCVQFKRERCQGGGSVEWQWHEIVAVILFICWLVLLIVAAVASVDISVSVPRFPLRQCRRENYTHTEWRTESQDSDDGEQANNFENVATASFGAMGTVSAGPLRLSPIFTASLLAWEPTHLAFGVGSCDLVVPRPSICLEQPEPWSDSLAARKGFSYNKSSGWFVALNASNADETHVGEGEASGPAASAVEGAICNGGDRRVRFESHVTVDSAKITLVGQMGTDGSTLVPLELPGRSRLRKTFAFAHEGVWTLRSALYHDYHSEWASARRAREIVLVILASFFFRARGAWMHLICSPSFGGGLLASCVPPLVFGIYLGLLLVVVHGQPLLTHVALACVSAFTLGIVIIWGRRLAPMLNAAVGTASSHFPHLSRKSSTFFELGARSSRKNGGLARMIALTSAIATGILVAVSSCTAMVEPNAFGAADAVEGHHRELPWLPIASLRASAVFASLALAAALFIEDRPAGSQDVGNVVEEVSPTANSARCLVCFETASQRDQLVLVPCGHVVCPSCWDSLRQGGYGCPMCRARVNETLSAH